ncbi:hypothetical protein ACN4EE_11200 [Geminocystis sp. CENA526]|uniref:hypothetical protein n=1 Tax=Geminocystis sp. CENA526 TaxID=1355871 RepID=UPI003D6EC004
MTNLDRYLENPQYKPPSQLKLLLGKYKIEHRLNNIYFSSDKYKDDKTFQVNISHQKKGQLITGYEEILDLEKKINISFSTIRTLNFYKQINKILIISNKNNIEKWQLLLESLLRDMKEEAVKKERQGKKNKTGLINPLKKQDDLTTFINSSENNLNISIVQDSLFSNIFDDAINRQCDLLILEDFNKYIQYNKKTKKDKSIVFDNILSKFKCYLTFSDKSEDIKESLSVTEYNNFLSTDKINYFILISHCFTQKKVYIENSAKNSDELMQFFKDFLETNYEGLFKVDINEKERSTKIIVSETNSEKDTIIKEIQQLAKKNKCYQFRLSQGENLCYFTPLKFASQKFYLIDLNHPFLQWIKNSDYFNKHEYHPLSVCRLKYDSDLTELNNDLKEKIKKETYFYLIAFCQSQNLYDDSVLIYQIKNVSETTKEDFTAQESEIFINYAFYNIGNPLPNAENREESKPELIKKEKENLAEKILKRWEELKKISENKSEKQFNSSDSKLNETTRQKEIKTDIMRDYNNEKQRLDRSEKETEIIDFIAFGLIVVE